MSLLSCLAFLYIGVGFIVEARLQEETTKYSLVIIAFWPLILIWKFIYGAMHKDQHPQ